MSATITEHKKCICVEFGETNNNKFWEYTIYDDGTAMTAYGRVGVTRKENFPDQNKALKKWAEKTNPNNKPDKRYTEVKAVDTGSSVSVSAISVKNSELKDVARKQIKSKNPIVQKLIDYLVQVNAHQILKQSGGKIIYDANSAQFKTPLGVIAPDQVSEARDLLVEISDFVSDNDFDNRDFGRTLNSYLRLIPHDVGMSKISPELIFPNTRTVIAENDLLDGLATSFIDVTTKPKKKTAKKKDNTPKVFDVQLDLVEDSNVIDRINKKYKRTKRSMHTSYRYKLKTIYKIDIKTVIEAFNCKSVKIGNIKELFHGTKCSSCLSILKSGLIIPPANSSHCTGRLGGNGIYASDISSKALNYATNFWTGGGSTGRIFMFLCDFSMGKMYRSKGYGDYKTPKSGYDSTFMEGGKYGLHNNEMIVYDVEQVNLKYLLEFN